MSKQPTFYTLKYGTTDIKYQLLYKDRDTLAIHVHPDSSITVEAPLDSALPKIEQKVHKRASWILKQRRNFKRYSFESPPRRYVSGESHRYLGRQYRLKVIQSTDGIEGVKLDRGFFHLSTANTQDREKKKKLLIEWYRKQAKRVFTERLDLWYPRFERNGIEKPHLVVRRMKSRWGSSTTSGKITLNLKLIMVPKQYIDYIIIHELCHQVEHNHSSAFYRLLTRTMPDWEERREKLNEFKI